MNNPALRRLESHPINILTTTKLGFLSRASSNRGLHMSINREGPTQSSIAKHFLDSGCCLNSGVIIDMNLTLSYYHDVKGLCTFAFPVQLFRGKNKSSQISMYFPNDFPSPFHQFSRGINGKHRFCWSCHVGWAKQAAFASSTPCDMEKQRGEAYDYLA